MGVDRRREPRIRISRVIPATVGRVNAVLVDLSQRGARVRHYDPIAGNEDLRFAFSSSDGAFSATAVVVGSKVVSLGEAGVRRLTIESRLRFVHVPLIEEAMLETFLERLRHERGDANSGASPNAGAAADPASRAWLRCTLNGNRWTQSWTRDTTQPDEGFLVPAHLADRDVRILCSTYENGSSDTRELIRNSAEGVVEEAIRVARPRAIEPLANVPPLSIHGLEGNGLRLMAGPANGPRWERVGKPAARPPAAATRHIRPPGPPHRGGTSGSGPEARRLRKQK